MASECAHRCREPHARSGLAGPRPLRPVRRGRRRRGRPSARRSTRPQPARCGWRPATAFPVEVNSASSGIIEATRRPCIVRCTTTSSSTSPPSASATPTPTTACLAPDLEADVGCCGAHPAARLPRRARVSAGNAHSHWRGLGAWSCTALAATVSRSPEREAGGPGRTLHDICTGYPRTPSAPGSLTSHRATRAPRGCARVVGARPCVGRRTEPRGSHDMGRHRGCDRRGDPSAGPDDPRSRARRGGSPLRTIAGRSGPRRRSLPPVVRAAHGVAPWEWRTDRRQTPHGDISRHVPTRCRERQHPPVPSSWNRPTAAAR